VALKLDLSGSLYLGFLSLLALERLVELAISRRNAAWALGRGGVELGQRHFLWMKLLHGAFFAACALEVLLASRRFYAPVGYPMLLFAVLAQGLRYWAIAALGRRWNVRGIAIPGAPAVTRGPYRYLRHPNYLAVIVEGIAVPMVHGAWLTAAGFTLLNAWLLLVRIRCEERALAEHCGYDELLGDRGRLLPWAAAAAGGRDDR